MTPDDEIDLKILTTRIKDIAQLLIDFTWKRTPQNVSALMNERRRLMDRRMKLLRKKEV